MSTRCMKPFVPKKKIVNGVPSCEVPCGKCPACLARRASGWSFRLMQEDKRSVSAYFLTLTYDTNFVPISKNGFMELSYDDVAKFYKRLRKKHASVYEHSDVSASNYRPAIRYYTVGEYGGRYKRPHYHAILFNADIKLMFDKMDYQILKATKFDGKKHVRCLQWCKEWKVTCIDPGVKKMKSRVIARPMIGVATLGTVNGASIGYTLKYMQKNRWSPMHRNDDRSREFSVMSKGLGDNYLSEAMMRWHTKALADRMYLTIEGGKKIAMPRYYKQKIYTDEQRKVIEFWVKKKIKEEEKLLLQKGNLETAKDAKARVEQEFKKMYKRAEDGRNKV